MPPLLFISRTRYGGQGVLPLLCRRPLADCFCFAGRCEAHGHLLAVWLGFE